MTTDSRLECRLDGDAATREWERQLAAYTARIRSEPPAADPGLALLRTLADQARIGQLGLARPQLLRPLIRTYGVIEAERLLWDYLNTFSPKRWSTDEGDQFAAWFSALDGDGAAGVALEGARSDVGLGAELPGRMPVGR